MDPYIAVQKAMTKDQCDEFQRKVLAVNPVLRGAHIADMLAMADEEDVYCGQMEEWWAEYGDRASDVLATNTGWSGVDVLAGISGAFIAAWVISAEDPTQPVGVLMFALEDLIERIVTHMEAE